MRIKTQGMNWIRLSTRLAIYHRDGFACVYCGAAGEELGTGLTLDHLVAQEIGGSSRPDNLVTACHQCNSAKQHLTIRGWLARLRARGIDTATVARRVRALVRRPLDRAEGRRLERAQKSRAAREN
jgi:5-methylcytosine-specific restriction endonuclease McrA